VRNDRPFTEIVTADYVMLSPYTARGYGVFDDVKARFKNPDDPSEYIPVKLKALVGRNKQQNQDSATGFYPHAGVLSTLQVLTGRKVLLAPKDLDDPLFAAKRRAYQEQRREVERIAAAFTGSGFNLKTAFKEWAGSPFYRADGLATALKDPQRRAELDDIGL